MAKDSFIITHGEDPDGIISAALLNRYLKNDKQYYFVSYARQTADFSEAILRINGGDTYLADLNMNPHLISDQGDLLKEMIKKSNFLVWIDHHEGTKKYSDYLHRLGARVIQGEGVCSAKLVHQEFLVGDCLSSWLSSIAQAHDYGVVSPELGLGEQLQKVISFYNHSLDYKGLRGLVETLSRDGSWQQRGRLAPDLEKVIEKYCPLAENAVQSMKKREEFLDISGRRIMVTYADAIIYHKDTLRNLKKEYTGKADAYLVAFGEPAGNVLFFRDSSSDFSPIDFCVSMGGGGREGDGGFSRSVDENNFNAAKAEIMDRLQEYLSEK